MHVCNHDSQIENMKQIIYILLAIIFMTGCNNDPKLKIRSKSANEIPQINYLLINHFPHSTSSFTEGLLFHNNELFESTGSPEDLPQTKSVFGILNLQTGEIDVKSELNRDHYFGEGIVFLKNKIYQLTYKKQTCFVYDAKTFEKIEQHSYLNEEGWGLTTDGEFIIMSDGTNTLSYREPSSFEVIKTLRVSANNYAIDNLNELEYIKGYIYSIVLPTNTIIKIDPKTGHVVGKIDCTPLIEMAYLKNQNIYEMNGIAYDSISDHIFVTGKMWPEIYEIKLSN